MKNLFRPKFSRERALLALAIAILADVIPIFLGPLGWTFADEVIDIAAMLAISSILGFHMLLLPTFILELVPVVDMLPTWTACVGLLISLRKKEMAARSEPPFIDINS